MISRGALIAVLVLMQALVAGAIVLAVHGSVHGDRSASRRAHGIDAAASSNLIEGGPSRLFDAGSHPALAVDIGNADLTISTGSASHFAVSVSKSTAYGMFRATAPLMARKDGETLRLATTARQNWSMGDDRLVTVVVPPETRITVVAAGDVKANGLRGEALLKSTNGSVTIVDYDAPALHVATSNGSISLSRIVAPRLDVTSGNGRVNGTGLQVRDGSVESSNGRVTLEFAAGSDTLLTAETSNGSVHVSDFAAAPRKSGDVDDDSSQTVRIGAASGRLDVQSANASIYISQSKTDAAKPTSPAVSTAAVLRSFHCGCADLALDAVA